MSENSFIIRHHNLLAEIDAHTFGNRKFIMAQIQAGFWGQGCFILDQIEYNQS